MLTYDLRPRVVNRSLFVDSLEPESVSTGDDETYMSSSFIASLMRQDTSNDEDANCQSLRPHTSLNNLP